MSASDKDVEFQTITFEQQRLFAARNKHYSFEFDGKGYWHIPNDSPSSQHDDIYFEKMAGDYLRGGFRYRDQMIVRDLDAERSDKRKRELNAELFRLGSMPDFGSKRSEAGMEAMRNHERLSQELGNLYAAEAAEPEKKELTSGEKIKIAQDLLTHQLQLDLKQAAGFARTVQQRLCGYHKRLTGQDRPNSDNSVEEPDFTISFSRQGEKIIAKLHTATDPELYSEFEILVSNLTDANGEPQRAPIKLISTKSKNSESGYWDTEGYHYKDKLKAEKFFSSIEEKKAAYAERNMLIEYLDNSKRIQYNKLSAKLQELRDEHERLVAVDASAGVSAVDSERLDSQILEIEYEIGGDPQLGKIGLLDKVTTIENEYGEGSSNPNPYIFFTDLELTSALAQANKFCGLDANDSKRRGEEDSIQKRYSQLVHRHETLIQEKESLVGVSKGFNRELKALDAAANKKRSFGLNVLLGVATLFTAGLALVPVAINRYFSIQERNERRKEIAASESEITERTKDIERQLNKINSEIGAITKEMEGQSPARPTSPEAIPANLYLDLFLADIEVDALKPNEYGSSHVVLDLEKRSGKVPVCSQAEALDKCGFLAKSNSQPPVLPSSQTIITQSTAHLDRTSLGLGQ